jgi:hypothetical protein
MADMFTAVLQPPSPDQCMRHGESIMIEMMTNESPVMMVLPMDEHGRNVDAAWLMDRKDID